MSKENNEVLQKLQAAGFFQSKHKRVKVRGCTSQGRKAYRVYETRRLPDGETERLTTIIFLENIPGN